MEGGRPFPQALEAERALLGALILEPNRLEAVRALVRPDDFYRADHGALFALLLSMADAQDRIDNVTLLTKMMDGEGDERFGGADYVLSLPAETPSAANAVTYADIVRGRAQHRRIIAAGRRLVERAYIADGDADSLIEQGAKDLMELGRAGSSTWHPVSVIVDDEIRLIEERADSDGELTGMTTGFPGLDEKLQGFHETDLLILAARPAMGKTALALNLMLNVALMAQRGVGMFSLEMSRGQLVGRLLSCVAEIDAQKMRSGKLNQPEWDKLIEAGETVRAAKIHIDDTPGITIADLRARARKLKVEDPTLGLIVIDYLQLMQGDDPRSNRQQQISDISRGLKILAKDLHVTVLALSQLNRGVEQRSDKRPMTSDLRESGAIEQDADAIFFIYRDEYYHPDTDHKGIAEVIIAKQRHGPTGMVPLVFRGEYGRFDVADDTLRI